MDEIKEILGSDHVIFKITDEIVDNEENGCILEKIGSLIEEIDKRDSNTEPPVSAALKTQTIISQPKIVPNESLVEKNPFKAEVTSLEIEISDRDYEMSFEELKAATRNRSGLPRLLPLESEAVATFITPKLAGKNQVVFGGCAGMYHYFLGIASVLQEKFDLSDVIFGGVSGGCFPALALLLDLPVRELHETWNKEILREIDKSYLKAFSRLNKIVFDKSKKYMPSDAHIKARDRLFISLTELPSLKNHIVHSWQTLDALLSCIQASCFIPIFDRRFWTVFDQMKYVDGGLSNNKPIPYPEAPHIYITTNRWREIPLHWYWCYTSDKWSDTLFNWGAGDALLHLNEFDFLPRKKLAVLGQSPENPT
jgi:hypothetical protein